MMAEISAAPVCHTEAILRFIFADYANFCRVNAHGSRAFARQLLLISIS